MMEMEVADGFFREVQESSGFRMRPDSGLIEDRGSRLR